MELAGTWLVLEVRVQVDPMDGVYRLEIHAHVQRSGNLLGLYDLLRRAVERVTIDKQSMVSN